MQADHFTAVAAHYAQSRPTYPDALYAWLAAACPGHALAWDVGAGNGQASLPLAAHFDHVLATDLSAEQIANAEAHPRIEYRVAPAERSGLPAHGADLVTVAQALHWFDRPAFYAEVRRTLVAGGLLAVWSYGLLTLHDDVLDDIVRRFHGETVGPYWPPERRLVDEGYQSLDLPFEHVEPPHFSMYADWTLDHLVGYLTTWSAVQRARVATGRDPVAGVVEPLRAAWGREGNERRVEWPLTLHVGRV